MLILELDGCEQRIPNDKIYTYGLKIVPYRDRKDVVVSCTPEDGQYTVRVIFWTPHPTTPIGIYVKLHPPLHIDDVGKRENVFVKYESFKDALFMDENIDFMKEFEELFSQFIAKRAKLHIARVDDLVYVLLYTGYKPEASSFCGCGTVAAKDLNDCIEYDEEEEPSEDALWVKAEVEGPF